MNYPDAKDEDARFLALVEAGTIGRFGHRDGTWSENADYRAAGKVVPSENGKRIAMPALDKGIDLLIVDTGHEFATVCRHAGISCSRDAIAHNPLVGIVIHFGLFPAS